MWEKVEYMLYLWSLKVVCTKPLHHGGYFPLVIGLWPKYIYSNPNFQIVKN